MAQNQHSATTIIKPFTSKFQPFGHVQGNSEETICLSIGQGTIGVFVFMLAYQNKNKEPF